MRQAVVAFVMVLVGLLPTLADENPKDAWAYINRGDARMAKGDYAKAIADYDEAIRLNPKDRWAYITRGNARMEIGDHAKAIADFGEAIRLNPKDDSAYINRGIVWMSKGDYAKAIADYDEAIRLNPKLPWTYNNRGNAWAGKKEYVKAIADYDQAIRLNQYFLAYSNRAWLEATCPDDRFRNGKKAVDDATKACDLVTKQCDGDGWKDASCLNILAAAYAESRDFESAVKWQTKAIELVAAKDGAGLQPRLELYKAHKPYRHDPKK